MTQGTPVASQLPSKPVEAMEPCSTISFYQEMRTALDGAKGISQAWLLDYAERAERCNIDKQTLTEFVDQVWATRKE